MVATNTLPELFPRSPTHATVTIWSATSLKENSKRFLISRSSSNRFSSASFFSRSRLASLFFFSAAREAGEGSRAMGRRVAGSGFVSSGVGLLAVAVDEVAAAIDQFRGVIERHGLFLEFVAQEAGEIFLFA